jgi:hypothetical protein
MIAIRLEWMFGRVWPGSCMSDRRTRPKFTGSGDGSWCETGLRESDMASWPELAPETKPPRPSPWKVRPASRATSPQLHGDTCGRLSNSRLHSSFTRDLRIVHLAAIGTIFTLLSLHLLHGDLEADNQGRDSLDRHFFVSLPPCAWSTSAFSKLNRRLRIALHCTPDHRRFRRLHGVAPETVALLLEQI